MTDNPGPPSPEELARALAAAQDDVRQLERALVASRHIGMAMGMVMERHRLSEDQAFAHLRSISSRRNVKLRDVAAEIIYTGEVPSPMPAAESHELLQPAVRPAQPGRRATLEPAGGPPLGNRFVTQAGNRAPGD